MANLGFLAALGTALAWGTYMVPFKKSKSSNFTQFQALMAVGIGFSGLLISVVLGYPLSFNVYGLLSGVLWAIANAVALVAIANLGLSKAVPIIASLIVTLSFLWGLIFQEIVAGVMVGFLGIGLIILGVIVISAIGKTESLSVKKGLIAAILAGLIWGSQWVPLKVGSANVQDLFFPICFGIFISGLIIFVVKRGRFRAEAIRESLLSGLIWNIGNLLSLISLSIIGLSKMGPISQSATLVAVMWGLFYFKEVAKPKAKFQVILGAIILFVGVITLGFA